MSLLVIDWMSTLVKTGQFILSFAILVLLHEMGHYFPAKWFKCRVDKFYLFFDPWFSIWKKKKGETEYGLGWIPFGGYVKIAGMIDESMDKEQLKKPAEPWEFRSKPAWQRLIIMIGGVVVNIILAIVIFIGITWVWGEEQLPVKNLKYGLSVDSIGKSFGLRDGDNVVGIDGKPIENYGTLESEMVLKEAKQLQVLRDNKTIDIAVPRSAIKAIIKEKKFGAMVIPRFPVIVDSVRKDAVIKNGTMRKGDTLIAINNQPFKYFDEFDRLKKNYADSIITLTAIRGKDTVTMRALVTKKGSIGFYQLTPFKILETTTKSFSLLASIP
ncbi:MAG: site-2 protease family protein, partial [Sediminibacterium sp.]